MYKKYLKHLNTHILCPSNVFCMHGGKSVTVALSCIIMLFSLTGCGCTIRKVLSETKRQFVDAAENQFAPLLSGRTSTTKPWTDNLTESDFHDGLAVIAVGGKCGFANRAGTVIIPCVYDAAKPFSEGLAAVKVKGKWGVVDSTGREIIKPVYNYIDQFTHGTAIVNQNKDKPKNNPVQSYTDSATGIVYLTGIQYKVGLIDRTGKEVIRTKNRSVVRLGNGTFMVTDKNYKTTYYNIISN